MPEKSKDIWIIYKPWSVKCFLGGEEWKDVLLDPYGGYRIYVELRLRLKSLALIWITVCHLCDSTQVTVPLTLLPHGG
jgi:hypothetical protein